MKHTVFFAVACMLFAGGSLVEAQVPVRQPGAAGPGEIRGIVVEAETGAPIPSASVEVWSKADTSLIAGALTRADGAFRIDGLRAGTYGLRVTMIGYTTHRTFEFSTTNEAPRVSADKISLARRPIALNAIDVNAESAVVIAPDRNTYKARDVAPAASNASEVLEAVPSVQVDSDGKVSLRGNENVVVQINGRPSPIRGAQLAGYLKQLPSNTLERVEVIPNPSAKQDPEGMAGIINIVLKQTVDLGRSGAVTLAASTADRYTGAGNFGYQGGPLTLFFNYGYNSDERSVLGINDRTRLDPFRAPLAVTEQDIDGAVINRGHNLSTSIDYRPNQRDLVFTSVMLNSRRASDESLSAYSELNGSGDLIDRYNRERDSDTKNWMADVAFGAKRTFKPQQHEISAELRMNRTDDDDLTSIWRTPLGTTASASQSRVDGEENDLAALTNQLTGQIDYTRMLNTTTKLETGYKGNVRWLDRDFEVRKDALGNGNWQTSGLSNALEFDERVNAVYAVLSQKRGKVDLQAGLRAEYAERDFSLEDGTAYPHNYTSLFPSGLISYNVNDKTTAKVSYSRRIRRPGTQELNPFPSFFDAQNVFLGNPQLGPEYTDAIELGLQRSGKVGSLQLAPFFRRTTDIIRVSINTADTVSGREVTSISFTNLATSESFGADLNAQFRIGTKFSGIAGFNVFKMVTDGGSESSLSSDALSWMGRINGTYNISPLTMIQAQYNYRAPMNIERGRFSSQSNANLAIRQKVRGDKASVTLRVSDPFNTMKFRVEVGDDNIIQLTNRSFNSRALHLTFQANFGQAPRLRQPRQDQEAAPQTGFPPPAR